VPLALLPACVPSRHAFGTLVCGRWAVPLVIVTGDQSASLFAQGAPRPDVAYANFGTGAFVQRPFADATVDAPRLLKSVVMREGDLVALVLEGTINGAGSAMHWAQQTLGLVDVERELEPWLARETPPPLFLNGISGLAAPFWVPDFPSRFLGEAAAEDKVVAVAESVLFLVQTILDEMGRVLPPPALLRASGGLSRVDGLCTRLAALAGLPVERSDETEGTAAGLAWLLGARRAEPGPLRRFLPEPAIALAHRYAAWGRAMQQALASA
jgi:glycerol kinase